MAILLTYMWEQNDRGAATGTGLINNTKLNGPLFRQFGVRAVVTAADTIQYNSPGENLVDGNPTRVFPDMAQILANNTNVATGDLPDRRRRPTAADIECYLGVPADRQLRRIRRHQRRPCLAPLQADGARWPVAASATRPPPWCWHRRRGHSSSPSPNTAVSFDAGSTQTVTWSVANTDIAPVSAANVKISLSTDGGQTFPLVLAASTPNNGSKTVTLPLLATSTARIKIEAVDNIFFDVSNANFSILVGDANGDGGVACDDLVVIKASMGKRIGQAGFNPRADVNKDGVVDIRDVSMASKSLPAGTVCK